MSNTRGVRTQIKAVDLFCGVGGLTRGLEKAGIDVRLGIDLDPDCAFPYEANNNAKFLLKSVEEIDEKEISKPLGNSRYRLLAGCAPCQPFSTYSQGKATSEDHRWGLLAHFARLVEDVQPELVTMENVPGLAQQEIFLEFVQTLEGLGFHVSYKTVNCADYGIAQTRNRLVLLASRLGPVELQPPTHKPERYKTVRDVIANLPRIKAGEAHKTDPLHHASSLSPTNYERIKASKPGGTWRDWSDDLVADCHKKESGKTYPGVYGRMTWDAPAPTMTTQFYGFGNGRFGHPRQNRAISLREGAMLQSFPRSYKFTKHGQPIHFKTLGRLIGNAVPVRLGEIIGRSLVKHVQDASTSKYKPSSRHISSRASEKEMRTR